MVRHAAIWAVLGGGMWLLMAAAADAQSVSPYTQQVGAPQNFNSPLYNSAIYNSTGNTSPMYTGSSVSPYLNLGYNQNGLSNYQTLVKPMIDEQDGLQRQAANLQKLQRQMRDTQKQSGGGPARSSTRYMNFSHYYGGAR